MRFKDFLFIFSFIVIFVGASLLLCIPFSIYYREPQYPFYISALALLVSGFLLYAVSGKKTVSIKTNRERVILITISWVILILAGTLPYLVSKTISSLVDVFFETVSGMTSTGSTGITNVENFPKSILLWRSLTHWIGGLATVIGLFTILPSLNIGGYDLFGIKEKTATKWRSMIIQVVMIYCALTFAQVLLLFLGGMNLFESLCHSFGTVSTGSFSPKNDSITGYSPYLQYTMALFMFLSGFSYVIYYLAITGKLKKAIIIEENRIYFIVVATISVLITGILYFNVGKVFGTAFRESVFQVVSFVSSSGYYTTNYLKWPSHILPLVYLLIFIGGSTGSASGGIKMSRFLILLKNLRQQFKIPALAPNSFTVKYNKKEIDENINVSILTFITVFGFLFVIGTISLSFFGTELEKCVFLAISALSNFGHHVGLSDFPDAGKIILSFLMILGRLEIYPLLLLFVPLFYNTPGNITEKISERE